ncbi:MAG: hypothetical protein KAT13_03355 [Methanosarcinales archaeon]|nr:hypothetical protein [Methanosarcinales archaeon]
MIVYIHGILARKSLNLTANAVADVLHNIRTEFGHNTLYAMVEMSE